MNFKYILYCFMLMMALVIVICLFLVAFLAWSKFYIAFLKIYALIIFIYFIINIFLFNKYKQDINFFLVFGGIVGSVTGFALCIFIGYFIDELIHDKNIIYAINKGFTQMQEMALLLTLFAGSPLLLPYFIGLLWNIIYKIYHRRYRELFITKNILKSFKVGFFIFGIEIFIISSIFAFLLH